MIRFIDTDSHRRGRLMASAAAFPMTGAAPIVNPFICHFSSSPSHVTSTQTSTSEPWGPQIPYLEQAMSGASNLYNNYTPQYYPGNQVAGMSPEQLAGIQGIDAAASGGAPLTNATQNFATNLEGGGYFGANPSIPYFTALASNNIGLNNPGATSLENIASSNPATNAPGSSALSYFANNNPGTSAPGSSTLQSYANGGYFSNNYSDPAAQAVLAQVVPQIQSQFVKGGSLNNPAAAYATAQGAASALAPLEFQNYQTQEQLQQNAASTLGNQSLAGAGLSENAASALGGLNLEGLGLQSNAASTLEGGALSGGGLQATGAEGLSTPFQQTLQTMTQGEALAPQAQAMSYFAPEQIFNIGSAEQQQAQNEINADINKWNFSQNLPYQKLDQLMQGVTGNYGGTSSGSSTQPYFQNPGANVLSGALGTASLLNMLPGLGGAGGAAGGASMLDSLLAFLPF